MEDILDYAVDLGRKLGATYAEARYQRDIGSETLLKNGVPEVTGESVSSGISVRVVYDGCLGFASTNKTLRRDVAEAVRDAVAMARSASKHVKNKVVMAEAQMARTRYEARPRVRFEAVDVNSRLELLKEVDTAALDAASKMGVKLPTRMFDVGSWVTEKHIVNSDGGNLRSRVFRATFNYTITVFSQQHDTIQRFENLGEARGWEAVEKWNMPSKIYEEVMDTSRALTTGKAPPEEPVNLILGPEIVGLVCHESCGHPGEADRMLGREAAQAGETYIKKELLGTAIGSEHVTVVDDPSIPHSFGYYLYDEECVKARERVLIDRGVLRELLHNRETAPVFGVESNGASRASYYDREPIVRMANTYMKPGDHSFEELLELAGEGLYIRSYQEWNIDDRRWNQRYVGVVAYRIRNGELAEMVRDPVVDLTTKGLYSSVMAVGEDLSFSAGYCGKGDPMQGIPVWFGGPSILLGNVRVGTRRGGGVG
ncbi:Metalloprotease TldD [archaeon HR01]|nr:Metalloprotease TldD [archaeon HR01]